MYSVSQIRLIQGNVGNYMADPLKVAVIGTGALGKHHARLYADLSIKQKVSFVGVYDTDHEKAVSIAQEYAVTAFKSIDHLASECDAVNVVTPTNTHFEVAKKCLELGCDVLVEKPITPKVEEAQQLVKIASEKERIIQVGHVERFNPVYSYIEEFIKNPKFIEAHRLSSFPSRSTDIGVVLDLMIHDLDIIMALVKSPILSVDAAGVKVLSHREDIANARIKFENGCTANLTASRVSPEQMRKIRIFSGAPNPSYVSLDYKKQAGEIYRMADDNAKESSLIEKVFFGKSKKLVSQFGDRKIIREPVPLELEEPLAMELISFVNCVMTRQQPIVSGQSATATLDLALEITRQITESLQNEPDPLMT